MTQRIKMAKNIFKSELDNTKHFLNPKKVDKNLLAQAMYNAYKCSIDYENDTIEDFKQELQNLFNNVYGKYIEEASFCVGNSNVIIAAVFFADFKGEPTLTYCFSNTEYRENGLAQNLIKKSENKLVDLGYKKSYLYLTLENIEAYNLFESLGYIEIEY